MQLAREFLEIVPQTMWNIRFEVRRAARRKSRGALTVPQIRVLAQLDRARGAPLTNGELAGRLGVGVPTMSRMVDGLVRRGFIARKPQPHDRRVVALVLSAAGKRCFLAIRREVEASFARQFSSLDAESAATLARALKILASACGKERSP